MSPSTGAGFDFTPWTTSDGAYPGLSDVYLRDGLYDSGFGFDFENSCVNPAGFDVISPASYSGNLFASSPAEAGLSGTSSPTADSDSEFCEGRPQTSPQSPTSPGIYSSQKRSGQTGTGSYDEVAAWADVSHPPPSKKSCSAESKSSHGRGAMKPSVSSRTNSKGLSRAPKSGSKADAKPRTAPSSSKSYKSGQTPKERKHSSSSSSSSSSSTADSSSGRKSKPQLRTACRRRKDIGAGPSSSSPAEDLEDDLLTPEERRARQNHNLVEKQYRNRLNHQFESLLAILPANRNSHDGSGSRGDRPSSSKASSVPGAGDADDRRLSKAEVLEMARQRIKTLEKERRTLQLEREELLGSVGFMRDAVAGRSLA